MTGRRHRSNAELVAQGVANMASALFGGICVTGTIARTATNVRAGARGPVAGMLHSAFLLAFMLAAASLASYIPLAALGAVLAVVAWNMAEKQEFATLVRASFGDAAVLLATFLLVVFRDLTEGILVGFGLGALLFLHRMAHAVEVERPWPIMEEDAADSANGDGRAPYDSALATDPDIILYRISGAFFFGAAANVAAALDEIGEHPKVYLIDFSAAPFIDSTAAATIEGFARKAQRHGAIVSIVGALPAIRRVLLTHGVRPPQVRYWANVSDALADARREVDAVAEVEPAAGRRTVKNAPRGPDDFSKRRALPDRRGQGSFIKVIEFAADRHAMRKTRDFNGMGAEQIGDVMGGRLAVDRRIDRQDHFLDGALADPRQQGGQVEIVGIDRQSSGDSVLLGKR